MNFSKITIHDPFIFCGSNYSVEVSQTGIIIKDGAGSTEIPYNNILKLKYIPLPTPNIFLQFRIDGESRSYTLSNGNFNFKRIKCLYKEFVMKKSLYNE